MYLTISQAAEYLGVHIDTLRRWEKQGKVKTSRIGKRSDRRYTLTTLTRLKKDRKPAKKRSKGMQDFVTFLLVVSNLQNIPRYGPLLFAGVETSNIAEHIFLTAIIASSLMDDFRATGCQINGEKLLKVILTHDIAEAVLGDIPTGSPSYNSFFDDDIRAIWKKAEKNVINKLLKLVENREIYARQIDLNDSENDALKVSDTIAMLIDILDIKFKYRFEWTDKMWNNAIKQLIPFESKYPFISDMIETFEDIYSRDQRPANPLLTQLRFNKPRKR